MLLLVGAAPLSRAAAPGANSASPDRLLVAFHTPVSGQGAARALAAAGAEVEDTVDGTGFSVVTAGPGRSLRSVRDRLDADHLVRVVESEGLRRAALEPNDLQSSQRQYMRDTGFPSAWDVTTGADDLVLAILDSGVDFGHSELSGRLLPGWDVVNDDQVPADDYGHGTTVAGVAAARTNNGAGIAGATWRGLILPVKVIDNAGLAADADIANGIVWATDNGADVINLSLGGPGASDLLQAAVDYAIAHDVVVVAAAGNTAGDEPHFPAACKGVVAVGASDTGTGALADFSNHGPWIDLVAPGVNIITTERDNPVTFIRETSFVSVKGTSFAAPLVASAALLVRAADRSAGANVVVDRLRRSATDMGAPGFDPVYGAGLLNAGGAVRMGQSFSVSGTGATGGYWMLADDGGVYPFGNAPYGGEFTVAGSAADLEPTPSGNGYWVVNRAGAVYSFGNAGFFGGQPTLAPGEEITSLSGTASGDGYWLFSTLGHVFAYGGAVSYGDMGSTVLNGPVLDSIPTRSGHGYYMVGSDGGIFAFGDAAFYGSTADIRLNDPVRSLVPDPDGVGYWLVAGDGGVFAFDAPFKDSVPGKLPAGTSLNAPITGMVPYGDAYLMVATDGGIFNFSDKQFYGSLGANPPAAKIVAVAASR